MRQVAQKDLEEADVSEAVDEACGGWTVAVGHCAQVWMRVVTE